MINIFLLFISFGFTADIQSNLKEIFEKVDHYFNPKICKVEASSSQQSLFKNSVETRSFIACVLQDKNEAAYEKYRTYINNTARHFGIDDSFFQCLLLQESKYDSHAISPAGAVGISQFLENNRSFVDSIIQGGGLTNKRRELLFAIAESGEGEEANKAQTRLKVHHLNQLWNSHFTYQKTKPPRQLTKKMLTQPEYAIPASALYLNYTFEFLFEALSRMKKNPMNLTEKEWFDLNLIVAGSYNMGHGAAVRVLGKLPAEDDIIAKWKLKMMSHNKETDLHIQKIQSCVEHKTQPKECR